MISDSFVTGGGLAVHGAYSLPGVRPVVAELLDEDVPSRLAHKDASLWGGAAARDAAIRLGWIDTFTRSRELLPRLAQLRAELEREGLSRIVLAGMGGSSLAPEVICKTLGAELVVLDTTDPEQTRKALTDLERTVVVVSSKSGTTIETESQRLAFHQAFKNAGLGDAQTAQRFVFVTDPGTPLDKLGHEMHVRDVFLADPNVGGRYSALTAFGLVPSALAGVDVTPLIDEADTFSRVLSEENPALALGAALGVAAAAGRDALILRSDGTGIVGLGDWIEQLIAESTGKDGSGILPVVETSVIEGQIPSQESTAAESQVESNTDRLTVSVSGALSTTTIPNSETDITVAGGLGAHFLAWEYATAIAGKLLQINPFDQPNVAESKENTTRILSQGLPNSKSSLIDGAIEIYADEKLLGTAKTAADALQQLLAQADTHGYVAVMAYLDREGDAEAAELQALLERRTDRPVTFGWGPRFLHSTGQYHKGGPQRGVFLQITASYTEDLAIPGQEYTFGTLQAAQAAGDRDALLTRQRPLLHLHLTDRHTGLAQLREAAR